MLLAWCEGLAEDGDGWGTGFLPPLLTGVGVLLRAVDDDDECCLGLEVVDGVSAVVLALTGCGVLITALGVGGWVLLFFLVTGGVGSFGDDDDNMLFLLLLLLEAVDFAAAAGGVFAVTEDDDVFLEAAGYEAEGVVVLPVGFLPAGV